MAQQHKDGMLVRQAKAVLDFNWTGEYTMPGPRFYPHQWSWDSALIALAYSRYDQERAVRELRHLFEAQWKKRSLFTYSAAQWITRVTYFLAEG